MSGRANRYPASLSALTASVLTAKEATALLGRVFAYSPASRACNVFSHVTRAVNDSCLFSLPLKVVRADAGARHHVELDHA